MINRVNDKLWKQSILNLPTKISPFLDRMKDGFDCKFGPFAPNATASEDQVLLLILNHLQNITNLSLVFFQNLESFSSGH
jgi:hypothetical protein